ncbi:MAG: hypothetical protein GX084_03925 [Acholeplasmataceae bacterium]|nr:tagaturonate epimerase family protein [Acidaminococcaceae bacterium]NLY83743.1 hypothetical protein [Acholeplasmataceae bacterium]
MAIKQAAVLKIMEEAAKARLLTASLSEISGGWLALADTEKGRRLLCAAREACPAAALFKTEEVIHDNGIDVYVMALNANNAAVLRRFVRWTAPSACGGKGLSIGFTDLLGEGTYFLPPFFAKRQIKPVLVDQTPEDCLLAGRNFLEAVDAATWAVFANGCKGGYGACATKLTTEEDLVKVLLYGYSMVALDLGDKINRSIEKMTDGEVADAYEELPREFREAVEATYLNNTFKAGRRTTISYTPESLRRIVLMFGEVIMRAQSLYNSYLKNTPWDIDFELCLSLGDRVLTPEEHYLVGLELTRNKVGLTSVGLEAGLEGRSPELAAHADIAEACGYRLSFAGADQLDDEAFGRLVKIVGRRGYLRFEKLLWQAALQCVEARAPELLAELAAFSETDIKTSEGFGTIAQAETQPSERAGILLPEQGNFAARIRTVLQERREDYAQKIAAPIENRLKKL